MIKDYINKIICGNCLEVMKGISDNSINLIIADPPYNINKADWDKIPNYVEWLGIRLLEMQRVLKDNGSFYLFHNDFLQIVEIQDWINRNTKFVFKQLIIWDKYTKFRTMQSGGGPLCGKLQNNSLRNYYQFTEYILYYTFQDNDYYHTYIKKAINELQKYLLTLISVKEMSNILLMNNICKNVNSAKQNANNILNNKSHKPQAITREQYNLINKSKKDYNILMQEFKTLKQKYRSFRYIFNNQKTDHTSTVWHYPYAKQNEHITPKPISLIKNILKHSSNEGDIILIPFVGSGNDCIACKELDRKYIGIEISPEYCEIARRRIKAIPELLF